VKPKIVSQRLPASGAAREALREKGQFWTPDWVAEAMVAYSISGESRTLFDPAVGAGAFFRAARSIERERGLTIKLLGTEIDREALSEAEDAGLSAVDLEGVEIADFLLRPTARFYTAIVGNPPYIRHHRLDPSIKSQLKSIAARLMGGRLDGRAGLHVYFLLAALDRLKPGGRLAFIMPADTCEGVFAAALWKAITERFRLEAVVTFAPEASPFPNVDTNPVIFLIRNLAPRPSLLWARCARAGTPALKRWMSKGLAEAFDDDLRVERREMTEALATGLSRPRHEAVEAEPVLADFASVLRGIATGANEFFFLTRARASALKIPAEFLLPAIGRTRDVTGDEVTAEGLAALDRSGRPTLLFAPDARPVDLLPPHVRRYLLEGERAGLDKRPLASQRKPWYKMERRRVPEFLFAYLGRRSARFIRNTAGAVPLTGFLCIYPRATDAAAIERLWRVLKHPDTAKNLARVGKSYGAGAIKVEPRALERLPLPKWVVEEVNLQVTSQRP
jgi:hypothetical protein